LSIYNFNLYGGFIMSTIKFLLGPMRVPFLLLTPACVVVGIGTAYRQTGGVNWLLVLLVLVGALAAHVSVNVFNEYFDFKSRLDARTQRTPFSGGSGTLQARPELEKATLALAYLSFIVTAVVGLFFVWLRGWQLLPLGIIGLLLLVTYTTWLTPHPILCLIAPGLGFGMLMVMGTHFALTGTYTWTAFAASLLPTFLVSNLLLLNQFPDVEADRSIGRNHFPIVIGNKASSAIFGVQLLLAYVSVIVGIILRLLPLLSALSLLTTFLAWRAYHGSRENAENIPALIPSMGINVIINLVTPVLLAIGLFIG
jgi:1,4-dihydroxy-2-naphthoate octaprenyltransferase